MQKLRGPFYAKGEIQILFEKVLEEGLPSATFYDPPYETKDVDTGYNLMFYLFYGRIHLSKSIFEHRIITERRAKLPGQPSPEEASFHIAAVQHW